MARLWAALEAAVAVAAVHAAGGVQARASCLPEHRQGSGMAAAARPDNLRELAAGQATFCANALQLLCIVKSWPVAVAAGVAGTGFVWFSC